MFEERQSDISHLIFAPLHQRAILSAEQLDGLTQRLVNLQ